MISGGDILILSYINNLINKVKIYNIYGPIETTDVVHILIVQKHHHYQMVHIK